MKKINLNDLDILITRSHPAGAELCELIKSHGGHAIYLPTIAFAPSKNIGKLTTAIQQLNQQDWLIFISPQAVYESIPSIQREWPAFPSHVKLAAVGKGTARALYQAGYLTVIHPKEGCGSEGLLTLPEFQSLAKRKVAIIRGDSGRDLLEQILKTRGAHVLSVVAYRRIQPEVEIKPYQMLLKQNTVDAIVVTSGEGVENLTKMIGEAFRSLLCKTPLIVVSERIKMLAHDLGFQTIWVAHHASHHAILEILAEKRKELCQMKAKL
ncbi:MAG TPA: uroporphyrinogen-III synthase [Gammaproteobacteria bacterium]|nr:uroporphyrinogen-III synthase [Gammaproteobacteria bacterium]